MRNDLVIRGKAEQQAAHVWAWWRWLGDHGYWVDVAFDGGQRILTAVRCSERLPKSWQSIA